MESWRKISLLLCIYGILKEFRPSEPYVTKYLEHPPMNFTQAEVSNNIYPVSIYTTMVSLVIVFLITDYLRYKPIIIIDTACAFVVFLMLITVRSLFLVQVLEVFYGLFMAGEVAYYTYIYAKVDKSHYQEVSGHTRAAYLLGRTISGVVSQTYIAISPPPSSYYTLNFFSLTGSLLATVWACFLPSVDFSIYFSRNENPQQHVAIIENGDHNPQVKMQSSQSKFRKVLHYLWTDFKAAFSNIYTVKWVIWWCFATCGYYQILTFVQVLWEQIIRESGTNKYSELNGAVEAAYTLLSAAASYGCGIIDLNMKVFGECVLFLGSMTIALLLILMSQADMILWAYGLKIVYAAVFNGMITIANSEIAKQLNPDSHGLIFGFTTFIALVFQSILTIAVNNAFPDELHQRPKFLVYSAYFALLGIFFGVIASVKMAKYFCKR